MKRVLLFIFSAFVFFAAPATAKDAAGAIWKVSEKSGDVHILRSGLQPVALRSDGQLNPGDIVATGATGRAVLTRKADYVIVAPNSRVEMPPADAPGGITRFVQQVGTLLYKVRRMGVPHFEVDTPMLAAVVKGTTFTVIVERDRNAVQVTEGKVEVTAISGGMQRLVLPGETVFINREDPSDLVLASRDTTGGIEGDGVRIDGTAPALLADIAALTGGLVQAAAPAQVAGIVPSILAGEPSVVAAPAAAAPGVAVPAVETPAVSTPAVSTPAVTVPSVTTPAVTVPSVTTPAVTVPSVTTPTVTVPSVSTPTVTVPSVTTPTVTVPAIITPVVTTPTVTVPAITTPTVTVPSVTTPSVTVPSVTTPPITAPAVQIPEIPVPVVPVTIPPVTVPPVTVPSVPLPPIPGL